MGKVVWRSGNKEDQVVIWVRKFNEVGRRTTRQNAVNAEVKGAARDDTQDQRRGWCPMSPN